MSILYDSRLLRRAAAALLKIDDAGLLDNLREELCAVRRELHERELSQTTRQRWLMDMGGGLLAGLTGISREQCVSAMAAELGFDSGTVLLNEIIAYAQRLQPEVRHSA